MRHGVGSQWRLAILCAVTLMVAGLLFAPIPSGQATDGRDFAGFYEVDNPSDLGNGQVQITFAVRVFNYADYDVTAATVNLCDSSAPDMVYGSFPNVSLAQGQNLRLQGTFKIPQSEYDSWQNTEAGGGPRLWIEFTDASGNPVKLRVELVSAPVGEDN